MSTGRSYEVSGDTTEWDDILIKKGIRTKEEILIEKGLNPSDFIKESEDPNDDEEEGGIEPFEHATLEELDELEVSNIPFKCCPHK